MTDLLLGIEVLLLALLTWMARRGAQARATSDVAVLRLLKDLRALEAKEVELRQTRNGRRHRAAAPGE